MGIIEILLGVAFPLVVTLGVSLALSNASPTEFLAARYCFIIAGLDLIYLGLYWLRNFDSPVALKFMTAAIGGAFLVAGTYGAIAWVDSRESSAPVPDIRISPAITTSQLKWNEEKFWPTIENNNDPFGIKVQNIGGSKATDIKIHFSLGTPNSQIILRAKESNIFRTAEGGENSFTIVNLLGNGERGTYSPRLIGNTIRELDSLDSQPPYNETAILYPPEIKNAVILWLLATSNIKQLESLNKATSQSKLIGDPQISDAERQKLFTAQLQEMQRDSVFLLPDLKIQVSYKAADGRTSFNKEYVIHSLYQNVIPANFLPDVRPRKLWLNDLIKAWLASKNITYESKDYSAVQTAKGEEMITKWNIHALGQQPTLQELKSMDNFARNQRLVLSGGMGSIGFEDIKNPSDGIYNIYKAQGLFSP